MARSDPRRQIGEKRRDLGRDLRSRIGVGNPGEVLLARLLHHGEARLQIARESLDCDRHDVGHDARALAAAEYHKAYQPRCFRSGVGRGRRRDHRRPHRIAGARRLGAKLLLAIQHPGEAGRDGVDPRRKKPVGASHHRVLLVDQRGDLAQRRRQHRRDGRIAAKADHRRWPHAREQAQALHGADAEHRRRARQRQRVAATHGRARDDVNVPRRKRLAVAFGAMVGRKRHGDAAPAERLRERFGGKQVSAGPAGGQQNKRHAVCSLRAMKNRSGRAFGGRQCPLPCEQLSAWTLARQGEQHSHAVGERDHR